MAQLRSGILTATGNTASQVLPGGDGGVVYAVPGYATYLTDL